MKAPSQQRVIFEVNRNLIEIQLPFALLKRRRLQIIFRIFKDIVVDRQT